MNNFPVWPGYVPELGILVLYALLFLGYLYEASIHMVRVRRKNIIFRHGLWILAELINIGILLQIFNLRHGDTSNIWNGLPPAREVWLLLLAEMIVFVLFLILYLRIRHVRIKAKKQLDNDSVPEAIINLPSGLCFAMENGRVILANTIMKNQMHAILGRPFADANVAWEKLVSKGEQVWSEEADAGGCIEHVLYQDQEGQIWDFRRRSLQTEQTQCYQIDSQDVTELVRVREELKRANEQLRSQNQRTRELLHHILDKKSEQEIIDMQRRVHHEVGQCIITANRYLTEKPERENLQDLIDMWEKTFRWMPESGEYQDMQEREKEIYKAAKIGGCEVLFRGERPNTDDMYALYLAAVREAVTNAMRHANATEVYVNGFADQKGLTVEISDNGKKQAASITEGVGLGKLRKKLEGSGVKMEMEIENGKVNMSLRFPERKGTI